MSPPGSDRRPSLTMMRLLATGMLVVMAGLYLFALPRQGAHPAYGYLRSFAEAAMVGGLADWFAVTALFRRPLGLPILHAAVIPRSKARIADALGGFVAANFLAPEVVRAGLQGQDLFGPWARQIATPAVAAKIADGMIDTLPALVDMMDDRAVADFLRRQAAAMSGDGRLAGLIGQMLRVLTEQGRHQPLVDAALEEGWRALEAHAPAIRAQVRSRTGWVWRLISVDARASDALITSLEDVLAAIAADRDHPARQRITAMLQQLAADLETSPALRADIQRIAADALAHPSVVAFLDEVLGHLRESLRDATSPSNQAARESLAGALAQLGQGLSEDQAAKDALNTRLRAIMRDLAGRHGQDVANLISDTIKSWDARTVVAKMEDSVGPDLQYIRINGTLIGGLIGMAIHALSGMLPAHL